MLKLELQSPGVILRGMFSPHYRTLGSYNCEGGMSYLGLEVENPLLERNIFYRDNPQEDGFVKPEALQNIGSLNVQLDQSCRFINSDSGSMVLVVEDVVQHLIDRHFRLDRLCSSIGLPRFDLEFLKHQNHVPNKVVSFIYSLLAKSDFELYIYLKENQTTLSGVGMFFFNIDSIIKYRLMLVRALKYIDQLFSQSHGDVIDKPKLKKLYPFYEYVDLDIDFRDCVDVSYQKK